MKRSLASIVLITALYSYTGIAYGYGLEWEGVTDFLSIAIGTQSEKHMITLTNHPNGVEQYREQLIREGYNIIQINDMLGGRFNVGIGTILIEGADTNNFYIQDDSCSNKELSYTGSGCTFYVTFSPSYNTPQKLDRGLRWMVACWNSKEGRQDG